MKTFKKWEYSAHILVQIRNHHNLGRTLTGQTAILKKKWLVNIFSYPRNVLSVA
jgi:hypothetical protein